MQITEKPDGVTLEQALNEDGKGRTPEKLAKSATKIDKAMKIMEEMWEDTSPEKLSGRMSLRDLWKKSFFPRLEVPHITAL